jgi:excisionase family DNA binding protein
MVFDSGYQLRMSKTNVAITWWLIDHVCEYLEMNESQVGRLVRTHGLPHRDFGRERRYPKELVEEWAERDIVVGSRKPRAHRRDSGRPAARREHRTGPKAIRVSKKTSLGIAAMPG